MQHQVKLDINDIAESVRAYAMLPNANVRFLATVGANKELTGLHAIASSSESAAKEPDNDNVYTVSISSSD